MRLNNTNAIFKNLFYIEEYLIDLAVLVLGG